jgi:restriction system protein
VKELPNYTDFMLPLLTFVGDGETYKLGNVYDALCENMGITDEQRRILLPSGNQAVVENRIGWAKTYLRKAGLIDYPKRGFMSITQRGEELLAAKPKKIDNETLARYDEFNQFKAKPHQPKEGVSETNSDQLERTPTETLEHVYSNLRSELAAELLRQIKSLSPTFFERLVVDLMIALGYGGSRKEAGKATSRSADGGIDGIISEDRLGLDVIYLQAKRWEDSVSRPELQKFAGALQGVRAKKGVFITTSTFTQGAREYVGNVESKIILIDGETLANLMIDFNVGVSVKTRYEIKHIDSDYFTEE